ncbi:ABC transporter substrate-binding protein [Pseudofrankia inefficax]|uniref:Extracellular ligand-binding receptor n=1 Tax=Pseudofrankia inefficax (strain DSM 45817 / CECT 9037 / DDB 130130 / EuI1c) TaxID=298654 RepID=E3IW15_PSEI1|nr:ABC transporter substrate-binding protein [Pseudofrankia inefficax]ADP84943.1 Extracellular ligand-binding receptor [Pseudofrankia inefficax]
MDLPRLHGRRVAVALAAVIAIVSTALAGCGGSPVAANQSVNHCTTQAPGVTANAIKIGLIQPDTGPAEIADMFGGSRSAVQARVDLQNAHGGVNGRRIDLVWGDDQTTPSGFSLAAHDLVDTQQVFGLVALTVVLDGAATWLQSKNVPVTGFASSADWSDFPNVFHFGNLFNKGTVSTYGDYVKAEGGTKAVIVIDPSAATSPNLIAALAASLQSRGVQVVDQVKFTHGMSSASNIAAELQQSGADALVGTAQGADFVDIYSQAMSLGIPIKVALNAGGFSASLLTTFGSKMAGLSTISTFAAPTSPAMKTYSNAMATYSPELRDPSDEIAIASYVAADEMIKGLQLAGPCPTRATFIDRLRQVTDFTGSGLMPPVDLSKPKEPQLCENFVKADPTGRSFTAVPPPAALEHDGFWCGQVVPTQ